MMDLPKLSSEAVNMLVVLAEKQEVILKPADPKEATVCLLRLRARYNQTAQNPKLMELLIEEDLQDLKDYPIDLIEKACKAWRDNVENQYAPRSMSQLMGECWRDLAERKRKKNRILALINRNK